MARSCWHFAICALSILLAAEHLAAQTPDARKSAELLWLLGFCTFPYGGTADE